MSQPGEEGEHRAPAEPPERPGHELLDRAASHRGLGLGEERGLDEVEVVEQADPGDPGQEVNPPQEEQPAFATRQRHTVPPCTCGSTTSIDGPSGGGASSRVAGAAGADRAPSDGRNHRPSCRVRVGHRGACDPDRHDYSRGPPGCQPRVSGSGTGRAAPRRPHRSGHPGPQGVGRRRKATGSIGASGGWWRWEELNLRHGAYETPALPLSTPPCARSGQRADSS